MTGISEAILKDYMVRKTAVAALNKHKWWGLYMDKIHTDQDRIFDTGNLAFLRDGTLRLLEELVK